jgi:hypothetical protein
MPKQSVQLTNGAAGEALKALITQPSGNDGLQYNKVCPVSVLDTTRASVTPKFTLAPALVAVQQACQHGRISNMSSITQQRSKTVKYSDGHSKSNYSLMADQSFRDPLPTTGLHIMELLGV